MLCLMKYHKWNLNSFNWEMTESMISSPIFHCIIYYFCIWYFKVIHLLQNTSGEITGSNSSYNSFRIMYQWQKYRKIYVRSIWVNWDPPFCNSLFIFYCPTYCSKSLKLWCKVKKEIINLKNQWDKLLILLFLYNIPGTCWDVFFNTYQWLNHKF